MTRLFLTCLLLVCTHAFAGIRYYAATIENTTWQVTANSRLQCELNHPIPRYGNAVFTSRAGKLLNMEFELDMLRLPDNYDIAGVYSVAPNWMPGVPTKDISQMQLRKQFDGDLPKVHAWTMLSELEKGFIPTIYYQDWYSPFDKVSVGLMGLNFIEPYEEFLNCISNLLPYSFDDIAFSVLTYKKNSNELTKASQKKLDMIGEYLRHDQQMELVLLDAYSDSFGGSWINMELSKRRANVVKDFFVASGIEDGRISVEAHGEKKHIASNQTEIGRLKNRRVVIQMAQQ
jgi:outer membrane protein OmpA-like peptidoglycan-associated protein